MLCECIYPHTRMLSAHFASNQVVTVALSRLVVCGEQARFQALVGFLRRLYPFSSRDQMIIMNKGLGELPPE